jgi:hypothetical protein
VCCSWSICCENPDKTLGFQGIQMLFIVISHVISVKQNSEVWDISPSSILGAEHDLIVANPILLKRQIKKLLSKRNYMISRFLCRDDILEGQSLR